MFLLFFLILLVSHGFSLRVLSFEKLSFVRDNRSNISFVLKDEIEQVSLIFGSLATNVRVNFVAPREVHHLFFSTHGNTRRFLRLLSFKRERRDSVDSEVNFWF